ncbi:MAG: trigger factor [Lachnospiraceae bacterium]|nr:trigger factor [Lachnospiraceae bacterium]
MKKRLLAMLMAGVVAVSVCACGGKAKNMGYDELAVDEYVTVSDYSSLKVQADKPEVTDTVVESFINTSLLTYYPVTGRAVQAGDLVVIDYVGKKDGVAFEGGTAEGQMLEIGSGTYIEGFESGLVGAEIGETVELNLTFPENYTPELAGEDVVFTVTVHEIMAPTNYESVTPEILATMGSQYTSKEEIWADAVQYLEQRAELTYQQNILNDAVEKLMKESTIASVPEYLIEEEFQNAKKLNEAECINTYGCDFETYITAQDSTMEQYEADLKKMCEETVKLNLIFESIARAEGIEVTDEMIYEAAAEEAVRFQYESAEAIIEEIGKPAIRMFLLKELVMEKLVETVSVEPVIVAENTVE